MACAGVAFSKLLWALGAARAQGGSGETAALCRQGALRLETGCEMGCGAMRAELTGLPRKLDVGDRSQDSRAVDRGGGRTWAAEWPGRAGPHGTVLPFTLKAPGMSVWAGF